MPSRAKPDLNRLAEARTKLVPFRNGSLDRLDGIYTILNAFMWLFADEYFARATWVTIFEQLHNRATNKLGWPQWGEQLRPFSDFVELAKLACDVINSIEHEAVHTMVVSEQLKPFRKRDLKRLLNSDIPSNSAVILGLPMDDANETLPYVVTGMNKRDLKIFDVTGMETLSIAADRQFNVLHIQSIQQT